MALPLLFLASTSIIVAGQPVDVGRPVVLWRDPEGFNAYSERCVEPSRARESKCCERSFQRFSERKGLRDRTLESLRGQVSQLVLHLDGCVNSRSCFYSMHDLPRPDGGCGLSAHFMIDADGTIYQTLDVLERAWHAEEVNSISIGVEICNRGDAGRHELDRLPPDYRFRPVKDIVVNGHHILAFDFRPEQYESVIALARTLLRVFPAIRPVIPEQNDQPLLQTLPNPLSFAGILGHLHVDLQRRKWDPGAFDWLRLKRALHGFHFPLVLRNFSTLGGDTASLGQALRAYLQNAEESATGFFPLAPGRLWHSGIHLRGAHAEPVYAPVRGRILAARLGEVNGSSTSFVLLRHELAVDEAKIVFFTLLAHLGPQAIAANARIGWIRDLLAEGDPETIGALREGRVALMDRPVEAGDVVGTVGTVSRGAERGSEVHMEIFSPDRLTGSLGRVFRFLDAVRDGPFARRSALLRPFLEGGNDSLGAEELRNLFRTGALEDRQVLRRLALRHSHEWGDRNDENTFLRAPELAQWSEAERRRLYERAIKPYQFWDATLSAHASLPPSQVVYFYHPVTFLVALAAHTQKIDLRWPPPPPFEDQDMEPTALAQTLLRDWRGGANEPETPLLGPVVDSEPLRRRKADIPLIVLPRVGE